MDKTCNNCKWLRCMFGCQSGRICLNYDCFEPSEMISISKKDFEEKYISRATYSKDVSQLNHDLSDIQKEILDLRDVLMKIAFFDLKPYENEYFYGADKLKLIAFEALE